MRTTRSTTRGTTRSTAKSTTRSTTISTKRAIRASRVAALLTRMVTLLGLVALGALGPATAHAQSSPGALATGLHISDGRLVEANGNDFVMRGVNHAHTWYPSQTQSFADIKALGANTVRVVLQRYRWTTNSAADVANVVSLCKANRLICVLENHDTTGYGEDSAARSRSTRRSTTGSASRACWSARRTTSSSTSATSPAATPTPAGWTAATDRRDQEAAQRRLRAHDHGRRAQLGPGLAVRHARQRPDRASTPTPPQHCLLDPHVRRLRHRRGDHRLSERLRRPPDCRIVIGEFGGSRPLGRRPGRGHDHVRGPSSQASATSAGRWSGNGGRRYLDMVDRLRPQPAHLLGPAHLQRRQRHRPDLPGGDRLRRRQPGGHPGPDRPRNPDRLRGDGHLPSPSPGPPPPTTSASPATTSSASAAAPRPRSPPPRPTPSP